MWFTCTIAQINLRVLGVEPGRESRAEARKEKWENSTWRNNDPEWKEKL
jgi:hypothetical protein